MKLGILNAVPSGLSQVNWQGTPVEAYIRFLELADAPLTYQGYAITDGDFPANPDACDAYLITGSPRGAYDSDPWIGDLIRFIRAAHASGRKFVGICFGHQVLAQALGGRVEKSPKGWGLGLDTFTVDAARPWMDEQPAACALYFAHGDQVVDLPPGAALLGGSPFCPNALYEIEGQVLGIQGHPEFTRPTVESVIARSGPPLGAERHSAALRSLDEGEPDDQLFARWIVNFLTGAMTK